MNYPRLRVVLRPQKGSVAVEAAVTISLIFIPLLAFMLFFGRYFWYYTAAQKAAHDATLAFATASFADVKSSNAGKLAKEILESGIADMDDDTLATAGTETYCLYKTVAAPDTVTPLPCNGATAPAAVKTAVVLTVSDPFIGPITGSIMGYEGLPITATATLPYVGR